MLVLQLPDKERASHNYSTSYGRAAKSFIGCDAVQVNLGAIIVGCKIINSNIIVISPFLSILIGKKNINQNKSNHRKIIILKCTKGAPIYMTFNISLRYNDDIIRKIDF